MSGETTRQFEEDRSREPAPQSARNAGYVRIPRRMTAQHSQPSSKDEKIGMRRAPVPPGWPLAPQELPIVGVGLRRGEC
jgi:hypothetical protein